MTLAPRAGETTSTLSLCTIVRNERALLSRCLDSVTGLVDEMVVVDTGSNDGSDQLARERGAKVVLSPWQDDFSQARNVSLESATSDWILVLDADEYLLEKDRESIRRLLRDRTAGIAGFALLNRSIHEGGAGGVLASIVRLFPRRADVRYESPIHEQIVPSLQRAGIPVVTTEIEIIHTGYSQPERNRQKQQRNLAILQEQIRSGRGASPLTYFLAGGAHLDLGQLAEALEDYRNCRSQLTAGDELARGAEVRIATCLVKLKRFADAVQVGPIVFDETWHPELRQLRGLALAGVGKPDEARSWFERVLACTPRAYVPACNVIYEKSEALIALGQHWRTAGRPELGVRLLRAALAARQQGADFTPADLREVYRQCDVPDGG